jgi:nicotinamidase-related amidase
MTTALLIIDVQQALCSGEWAVFEADRVIACGLQSEFCVDSTVRRALALGYPVTLVADGHSTLDSGGLTAAQITAHHNTTLANMQSFGPTVQVVAADQVHF